MMENEEKMRRVCERLRVVERTRLLCGTLEELGELMGCSLASGNGLARKGGSSLFMKDAMFRELAYVARERMDVDLEEVVDAYVEMDGWLKVYGKSVARSEEVFEQLVRYFYGDGEVEEEMVRLFEDVGYRQVPVLVLLLMGVLPRLSVRGGDVKEMEEDYRRVFAWLRKMVGGKMPLRTLPVLEQMEEDVREDASLMCRLHLIYIVKTALEGYGVMSTPEGIGQANRELAERLIAPDVEGIWVEDEASTVFWQLELMVNSYRLRRYVMNSGEKRLMYEQYTLKFYRMDEGVMVLVVHPRAIQYALSNEPVPSDCYAYLDGSWSENELVFTPLSKDAMWFPLRKLRRSGREADFQRLLTDERWTKVDRWKEYAHDFMLSLAAITAEHLYLEASEGGFYKVPKSLNPVLEDVHFGDDVGIITFANSTYVAFDDKLLYYDVSTEEKMGAWGIEKVKDITNCS